MTNLDNVPFATYEDVQKWAGFNPEPKYLDPDQVDGKCQQAKDCSSRSGSGIGAHDSECAAFSDYSSATGASY